MKKILSVIVLFSISILVRSQLVGDGTFASPWSGTMSGDATWSDTKYINGDISVDNEKLTISPGAVIVFLTEGADLIIAGTGSLDASGTSGSRITITADDDNDGIYGESGERWGHIYFNAPNETNQSKIDFCTIEYGDVHTFSDYQGYGGAIHSNFSNLIISNTTLRNNYGDWGGGLFINVSKNPTIRNCYIYNNRSDHGGGGIYCWNSSGPVIENCIFDSNQCLEASISYYTGGGLAAQTGCSVKVINCTFVNNTSTRTEGQSLLLHSSSNSRVINSIFWGSSSKQIYCYGSTSANVLINCAYRGITYTNGSPVNPVVLNSVNDASDGPNFIATDGSNWSIAYISPCRDAGVNSYTGVTIPFTDYENNPRIQTKDIGTYEVQYSRWTGTTSDLWATSSNWEANVDPSSGTGDVIIPTGLSTNPVNSSNPSFTIGSGKQMILNPGAKVTLSSLTNSGTLRLGSDASNISSLIAGSFSGNAATVELYLTGGEAGSKNFRWHYISTPVSSLPVSTFTTVTPDIVRYWDSRVTTDLVQGWVAQDGYIYATGTFGGPTFTALTPGLGYDFYDSNNNTFTFSGQLNTADVPMTLNYAGGANNGFNLLGNPFSSGLDWNYIITHRFPSNTSKGLYFTRDNALCSYIGGVGVPSDVNGYIPPMQGFFTKTSATGKTIYLADSAKTHTLHARYKGSEIIPLIRLSLAEDTLSDETVVRFDIKATADIDNDFDALKIFYSADYTSIYSTAGTSKFVINGLPFPETSVDIPIGVNMKSEGIHSISTTQLEGLDQYSVSLIDNVTGFTADLRTTPVLTFTASAGSVSDRFILRVSLTTGIEDPASSERVFNIYYGLGSINIQPLADEWDGKLGSVMVYDIAGKTVSDLRNTEFSKNSVIRVSSPASRGIYLVEIKSGMNRYAGKVVIK